MISYKFIISGKVQGVYYRKSVQSKALEAGFSGYVKNLKDARVEACVTCSENRLNEFVSILKKGSSFSLVNKIMRYKESRTFIGSFKVVY